MHYINEAAGRTVILCQVYFFILFLSKVYLMGSHLLPNSVVFMSF